MGKKFGLENMLKVLTPPIYVLGTNGTDETVDKLTPMADGKGLARERYLITARQQCTCVGFMKTNQCKHLKMLKGEYEGKGVIKEAVIEVLCRLKPLLDPTGPDPLFFVEEMPDTITSVKIKATTVRGKQMVVVSKVKVASTDFMLYIHCNE